MEHISTVPDCKNKCKGTQNIAILGKHFDSVCTCHPLIIINPKGQALENAKEIVLILKKVVEENFDDFVCPKI